jgi:hypothetical protein
MMVAWRCYMKNLSRFIFLFLLVLILTSCKQQPIKETLFTEDQAFQKAITDLKKPNLVKNESSPKDVKYCGRALYEVNFSQNIKTVMPNHYLVTFDEEWTDASTRVMKSKRTEMYLVSLNALDIVYTAGNIQGNLGSCDNQDYYGFQSFVPVKPGVFINQSEINAIQGHLAEKETVLKFIKAWVENDATTFLSLSEEGMQSEVHHYLMPDEQFAFQHISLALYNAHMKDYCLETSYESSNSKSKEFFNFSPVICVHPTPQSNWKVYMID